MEPDKGGKRHSALTILKTLKRRKFYLLVPMVLVTAAVAVYTARLPERFRAKALVASETVAPEPYLGGRVDAVATVDVQEHLRAVRETLFSPPLLEAVVREFDLYDVSGTGGTERAINALKARIQIQVDSPDAFYVGFEDDRPQQAMQVANRLAALFVERTSDLHGERVAQVDSLLDEEVNRLRSQLADQEEGLKRYQQSVAQELPDRLAANLKLVENLQQQSQTKSDQIAEAQARRLAVVDEIASLTNQGALEPAPRQKTVNEANLDDLRLKLTQLKTRYTVENPEIQKAEKAVRELEALGTVPGARTEPSPLHLRYIALQAELTSIDQRVKSYQQERAALTSQMANYEQRIDSSPGRQTTLGERTRDAALTRTQYETMLSKQQAQKLDQRVEKTTRHAAFRVIEPAELPSAPYSPQRARMILMGFAAGLGLGLALVMLLEQMDTSFETIEEVRGFTSIPVLSAIPTISNQLPKIRAVKKEHRHPIRLEAMMPLGNGLSPEERRQFQTHRLTVLSDPQSVASQQYNILKLKVQRWREQTAGRVLVVTSAAGGEGKSLTALNLGMALASSFEGRVLLVDCDLRRPQVHERLGLKDQPGLSDLLAVSDCDVDPFISKVGNLWVMPGGTHLSDPAGLLSLRRMREIVARLREEYQLIVFDSPPIVPIADSYLLSGLADGVILVIRARKTRRELLQLAIESFGATNILGIVLNDVEYGNTPYAYAYQYYQRHYMSRR
jgi:polysaccharide chain length determinant protein (PEP-CTERM system associated)